MSRTQEGYFIAQMRVGSGSGASKGAYLHAGCPRKAGVRGSGRTVLGLSISYPVPILTPEVTGPSIPEKMRSGFLEDAEFDVGAWVTQLLFEQPK